MTNYLKLPLFCFFLFCLFFASFWQPTCLAQSDADRAVEKVVTETKSGYDQIISKIDDFIREKTYSASPGVRDFMSQYYSRRLLELSLWGLILVIVLVVLIKYFVGKIKVSGKPKQAAPRQLLKEAVKLSKKGDHVHAGDLYLENNMYKKAIEQYSEAKAYSKIAEIYKKQNDWEQAADIYENIGNYSQAAEMYIKANRLERAEQMYLKDNRETLVGEMYEKFGNYRKAGIAFMNSSYFERAAWMFDKAEDHLNAAKMFQQSFAEHGGFKMAGERLEPRLLELITKAAEHYKAAGQLREAAEAFAKGGLFERSAEIYIQLENYERAADYFQKAEAPDKAAEAFDKLGESELSSKFKAEAYLRAGDYAQAAVYFSQNKDYSMAADLYVRVEDWANAAIMYENTGDYDAAAEMLIRAEKFKEAAGVYEKAGQLQNAAAMYERMGDFRNQIQVLYRLKEFYKAGKILMENGLVDDALKVFQQVPSDSVNYKDTCIYLGNIFLYKNRFNLAMKKYQEAIGGSPVSIENLEPYYFTALILEGGENFSEALKIYHDILSVDFNYRDVQSRIEKLKEKGVTTNELSADTIVSIARTELNAISLPEFDMPISEAKEAAAPSAPVTFSWDDDKEKRSEFGTSTTSHQARYEMIEEVGRGGMGVVFKANDKVLNRIVAFKVLSTSLKDDEGALENFFREARSAAALNHPNIIHIYDASTDEDNVFIVMEYVDGINLKDLLRRRGILKPTATAAIFRQVCAGLGYAHSRQVIHRDIKPSNIMITQNKQVKIADFGLAKVLSEMKDSKTLIRGTPFYMSPEQVMGSKVDHRSDIYSMGIALYEMSTGVVPFSTGEVSYHHVHTPPPDPKDSNADIPEKLREITLKCLEKEPDNRYQNMMEISNELKMIL